MAGPKTVQRIPTGLLDYLSMKGTGDLPNEIAGELRAMVDTSYLYLVDRFAAAGQNNSVGGAGNLDFSQIFVPAGELWVLSYVTVSCSAGLTSAGDKLNCIPYAYPPISTQAAWYTTDLVLNADFNSGNTVKNAGIILRPFDMVMTPGWKFGLKTFLPFQATTNPNVFLSVGYYRLTI